MSAAEPYIQFPHRRLADTRLQDADGNLEHEVLGWALHLEVLADAAWPMSALLPADCPAEMVERLRNDDLLLVLPGGRYRMPEFEAGREARARRAAVGGRASSAILERKGGRFQPATATGNRDRQPPVPNAGGNGGQRSLPTTRPASSQPEKNVMEGEAVARTADVSRAHEAPAAPVPPCMTPDGWRLEHRNSRKPVDGGWRCTACEFEASLAARSVNAGLQPELPAVTDSAQQLALEAWGPTQ